MRSERLRPLPPPAELAVMYVRPHDHRRYGHGHYERVEATVALAIEHIDEADRMHVGDLSCGNAVIARRVSGDKYGSLVLGDYAEGYEYHGPLEETTRRMPIVDTYICSETIEHLDDPAAALTAIRAKATFLVLSTPLDCWGDINTEHVWSWDREYVEALMSETGWSPIAFTSVDSTAYDPPEAYFYGIWVAE